MRCLLKSKDLIINVYWIKREKNKVIGSFWGNFWEDIFGFPIEVHFTYPKDGKVHYSYKNKEKEYFVTAFSDVIKIKESDKISFFSEKNLLNHLLPGSELQRPLVTYNMPNTIFHFPTVGQPIPISLASMNQKICKKFYKKPSPDDLVIDVDGLVPGTLNVIAFIASADYPQLNQENGRHWQKLNNKCLPVIGFSVIHCSNERKP